MGRTKDCITILPITPIGNPNIGLMVMPFVMDVLGKKMGLDRVLSLNVKGAKFCGKDIESNVSGYLKSNCDLGIISAFVWRDDQGKNIFWVKRFFHKLWHKGYIFEEKAEIMKCKCGTVESLANAENISFDRRLYRTENDKRYCNLCNEEAVNSIESVYLFRFPDISEAIEVFPVFYKKELLNMARKFAGFRFLISKSRPSALTMWMGQNNIFLDVDFIWQMFLPILRRYGYRPKLLIGSSKNLLACCFAIGMFNLIDAEKIVLVIPPYYLAPGRTQLKEKKYLLSCLSDSYGSKAIRLFLSTAINWRKKESVLDFGLLSLISKMSYRINSLTTEPVGIERAIREFDGLEIKKLLAKIRRNRTVFHCKELFGVI